MNKNASVLIALTISAAQIVMVGCSATKSAEKKKDFFTSGCREADQRASQRMARDQQLAGSGEGAGEKGAKKRWPEVR